MDRLSHLHEHDRSWIASPHAWLDPARTASAVRIRETSLACDRVELPEYVVWSTVAHKGVEAGVALGRERRLADRALEMGLAY
jgi:hypothetical protein